MFLKLPFIKHDLQRYIVQYTHSTIYLYSIVPAAAGTPMAYLFWEQLKSAWQLYTTYTYYYTMALVGTIERTKKLRLTEQPFFRTRI